MKISIKYTGREINFSAGEVKGNGFNDLTRLLNEHKDIEEVFIEGENGSYTTKRQVYLFANFTHVLTGAKITLSDDGLIENGLAKVTYKEK